MVPVGEQRSPQTHEGKLYHKKYYPTNSYLGFSEFTPSNEEAVVL
jgi:hypothetical protein